MEISRHGCPRREYGLATRAMLDRLEKEIQALMASKATGVVRIGNEFLNVWTDADGVFHTERRSVRC